MSVQALDVRLPDPSPHATARGSAATGRVMGPSMLAYPPTRRHVSIGWTTTVRSEYAGAKIARPFKLETLAQALALEIGQYATDNGGENAPIMHINQRTVGYHRITGRTS